jgi:hypothetical protein
MTDEAPRPGKLRRLLRIRRIDRPAEAAKRREAEKIAVRQRDLLPAEDVAGFDPYGRTRITPRFQPGERGRVDPPSLGGEPVRPNDPFGGVSRRRG